MPDVYAVWEGFPLWIELKVIKANKVDLRPQQVAWHTAHTHSGGLSFILVKSAKDRGLFLFEGRTARSVASDGALYAEGFRTESLEAVFEEMRRVSIGHWSNCLRSCEPAVQ